MALEPMEPEHAVEQYLASREIDTRKETLQNLRYRLKQFVIWADETDLDTMSEMSGRKCEEFKNWRITTGGLSRLTLEQHLRTFRLFIRWCESNEAVEEGTADKIIIPNLEQGEDVREEMIESDRAEQIIDYVQKFDFASRHHVTFHILWHTGIRRGTLHALDVDDWKPGENYFTVRHRPETGTPLKIGEKGERNLTIADNKLVNAICEYLAHTRPDVTDDHGRKPFIATKYGRATKGTIQNTVYKLTRPCYYTGECPHQREIDSCDATNSDYYSKCPSSHSPHPIRRGSITAHLNGNIPKEVVSGRAAVSTKTLDKHYDGRSHEDKRGIRKQYLNNL